MSREDVILLDAWICDGALTRSFSIFVGYTYPLIIDTMN